MHIAHLNRLKTIRLLTLAHRELGKGEAADLQFFQSLTVLQIEVTLRIVSKAVLLLRETLLSNHHLLQRICLWSLKETTVLFLITKQ